MGKSKLLKGAGHSCLALGIILCVLAVGLFSGPAAAALIQTSSAAGADFTRIKRVAFLPLFRALVSGPGQSAACPLGREVFMPGPVAEAAEAELSRAIGQALLGSALPVSWTPQAEINAALEKLKKEGHPELTTQGSWQIAIGKQLPVDAILTGFIYTYRDRVGGPLTASRPAALAFCLHLLDPSTGKILWSFRYEDEQLPLSENLLELGPFLHRRGQWITVAQMAQEAAAALVKKLPWSARPTTRNPS